MARQDYHLRQTGQQVQDILDAVAGKAEQPLCHTTAYWDAATGYTPPEGTIIVYTDYATVTEDGVTKNVPGVKIGNGNAYVQDLAFLGEAQAQALLEHTGNTTIHITAAERTEWNNKLNVNDFAEVVDESLILNRN